MTLLVVCQDGIIVCVSRTRKVVPNTTWQSHVQNILTPDNLLNKCFDSVFVDVSRNPLQQHHENQVELLLRHDPSEHQFWLFGNHSWVDEMEVYLLLSLTLPKYLVSDVPVRFPGFVFNHFGLILHSFDERIPNAVPVMSMIHDADLPRLFHLLARAEECPNKVEVRLRLAFFEETQETSWTSAPLPPCATQESRYCWTHLVIAPMTKFKGTSPLWLARCESVGPVIHDKRVVQFDTPIASVVDIQDMPTASLPSQYSSVSEYGNDVDPIFYYSPWILEPCLNLIDNCVDFTLYSLSNSFHRVLVTNDQISNLESIASRMFWYPLLQLRFYKSFNMLYFKSRLSRNLLTRYHLHL